MLPCTVEKHSVMSLELKEKVVLRHECCSWSPCTDTGTLSIWRPRIGEVLAINREVGNAHDCHAATVFLSVSQEVIV